MGKGKTKAGKKPMRRSRKPSKDETVEVRTAGIGDNSGLNLPAPDDFNHHKATILGWREKVTTAQGHLRNAIKTAKKAGINMEALNMVVGIERDNDPAKAMDFFRQVDLGLEHGESSLRLTVHDTLAGDESELVARRGFEDGKAARPQSSDYPEGSDLAAIYSENWLKGQAAIFNITASEEPEKVAAE